MRIDRGQIVLCALLVAWVAVVAGCRAPAPPADAKNVILISIDSLRADHLGAYGYAKPTSPQLDAFAAANTMFRHAYAPSPWTLPSHASIFTGLYPGTHAVGTTNRALNPNSLLLGNVLKRHGYQTSAVVCAPLLGKTYGFQHGFQEYDTKLIAPKHNKARLVKVGPEVTARGLKWLSRHRDKSFFLFLHYWDVHYDYNPPPEYVELFDPDYQGKIDGFNIHNRKDIVAGMDPRDLQHLIALYDGEIRYTDDAIGKLLAGLTELGLAQNTMVIVTADHGDEFLEHGGKGHTRTCYEEVVRVPLLVRVPWLPGAAGRVVEGMASLIDLFPTVLALLGIDSQDLPLQGISLADAVGDGRALPERSVFVETMRGKLDPSDREFPWSAMIAPDRWKLHRLVRGKSGNLQWLYDLNTDPAEVKDLAPAAAERADTLGEGMAQQRAANHKMRAQVKIGGKADVNPELKKTLKGLGYIQ